jgi:hypothetical protein
MRGHVAGSANSNLDAIVADNLRRSPVNYAVHPSWLRLIRYCAELGHGEIEKLKIQDGLPIIAEVTTRKVKFSG